jgi:chemotaxis protein histidine kinase CheA
MQKSHFLGQFASFSAVDPSSAVPTPTPDGIWYEGSPSIDIDDWLSSHTHSTSSLPTSSSDPALSPAAATRTTTYPTATQAELQLSIEQLLENPLTAALVTAQLKQRAAQAPQPAASTPSAPIAKPRAKRNKVRPKDTLDMLQKHLDDITAQVSELSVTNEQLQKKNRVLDQMVDAVGYFEGLAARACEEVARHNRDPSQPLQGGVRCKDWTAAQFLAFYRSRVASSSKWLLAADGQITPDVNAQLVAVNNEILDMVYHLCYFQPAIMPSVKAEVLKDWGSSTTSEVARPACTLPPACLAPVLSRAQPAAATCWSQSPASQQLQRGMACSSRAPSDCHHCSFVAKFPEM